MHAAPRTLRHEMKQLMRFVFKFLLYSVDGDKFAPLSQLMHNIASVSLKLFSTRINVHTIFHLVYYVKYIK